MQKPRIALTITGLSNLTTEESSYETNRHFTGDAGPDPDKRDRALQIRAVGASIMIKSDRDVAALKIPVGQKSFTVPVKTKSPAAGLFLLKRTTPTGKTALSWFFRHGGKRYNVGNAKTSYATACELYHVKSAEVQLNQIKPADERPRWTLDTLFNKWIDAEGTDATAVEQSGLWRKHWSPVCGSLVAVDVTYRQAVEIVNAVRARMLEQAGKVQANALSRGARMLARMYAYGYKHGIATPNDTPIAVPQTLKASIDKNLLPLAAGPRQFTLTAAQFRDLFYRLPDSDAGNAIRVIMLTGRRKREASEMVRQELRGNRWIIPGNRTKNGKPQEVPILAPLRAVIARSAHEVGRLWDCGPTTLNVVLGRLGVEASDGEGNTAKCTIHDLRRTWAELLRTECKLDRETVDLMLAHTPQTADGTSQTYQKLKLDHQSTAVVEGWQRWEQWWQQNEQPAVNC